MRDGLGGEAAGGHNGRRQRSSRVFLEASMRLRSAVPPSDGSSCRKEASMGKKKKKDKKKKGK
jgi:hypothetical protein